ncbi:MAG: prephenate dehydratase domain-containing protein [Ardenticatenaceae bacterium]|nr:prephenate dehydratase domain-containing protein [Ardenticatenaceae bacterium]
MSRIFYFGPELTFSHQAADLMRRRHPQWATAPLVACPTAEAIFSAVLDHPHSCAIVPFYNQIQGTVYDFMRFFLLDQVDELDLPIYYALYARTTALEEIRRVYTKDTVVPQVSDWLAQLPPEVEIISSLEISTADAARQAAQDPQGAAICSRSAGEAHELTLITKVAGNSPDNFTRFGLFTRPHAWWTLPARAFDPPEHPVHFDDLLWQQIVQGNETFYWTLKLKPESSLHLGHLSVLLTLRKFGRMGNQIVVLIDDQAVDDHLRNNYRNNLLAVMGNTSPMVFHNTPPLKSWIAVAGIQSVLEVREAGRPALLLDYVPGLDGYAKMSTGRQNTVSWPLPAARNLVEEEAYERIKRHHFSPRRLAAAAFDWEKGPQ